jgi:hypothetical protein
MHCDYYHVSANRDLLALQYVKIISFDINVTKLFNVNIY